MRRVNYRPYLLLGLFFLSLFSVPSSVGPFFKRGAIGLVTPFWKRGAKETKEDPFVRSQIESMREFLLFEERVAHQVEELRGLVKKKEGSENLREIVRLKGEHLIALVELNSSSLLAPVIFREPSSWNSHLWIGVGEKDNLFVKKKIVAKNSPVVVGGALVGVVEEVGQTKSRVRLITDSHLTPSVRVMRGYSQNHFLLEELSHLLLALEGREDLHPFFQENQERLLALQNYLKKEERETYLAKGEIHGASLPLWRSCGQKLKGVGFNYSFPDPFSLKKLQEGVKLVQKGDLLVTTGLDGVFPAGLYVGVVSHVEPLKEGASSYDLEALIAAPPLEEIERVFVLPPLI